MDSGYRIEWSEHAINDFNTIVRFLSENWGKREIRNFVRLIDKNISQIQAHPDTWPRTSYHPGLRRCVLSKIHTLYYLVEKDKIYIVTIWDNRSNNKGLKRTIREAL